MSDPTTPTPPAGLSPEAARQLAAAMIDEQAARAEAAADAPRASLQAQIDTAYPALVQRFTIKATADGRYATVELPRTRSEVKLMPSKLGFIAQLLRGGPQHGAFTEVGLLNALERIEADEIAAHGAPPGPTPPARAPEAARDAQGRFAPPAPAGEQPRYSFEKPGDVTW